MPLMPSDSPNNSKRKREQKEYDASRSPEDPWAYLESDEPGAELAREARVWKVYIGETDKWDAELVDGWNKSLDVLLGKSPHCFRLYQLHFY
ncbi:hypothetical protein B0J17DRAFT_207785 [Rhizoctonia solani]|nr:hypothetical protein B0J17DRAFT_207785 [Rhizoctonia solani]